MLIPFIVFIITEKAASALELSKDRRIEDLERQVRFLETQLMYLSGDIQCSK